MMIITLRARTKGFLHELFCNNFEFGWLLAQVERMVKCNISVCARNASFVFSLHAFILLQLSPIKTSNNNE